MLNVCDNQPCGKITGMFESLRQMKMKKCEECGRAVRGFGALGVFYPFKVRDCDNIKCPFPKEKGSADIFSAAVQLAEKNRELAKAENAEAVRRMKERIDAISAEASARLQNTGGVSMLPPSPEDLAERHDRVIRESSKAQIDAMDTFATRIEKTQIDTADKLATRIERSVEESRRTRLIEWAIFLVALVGTVAVVYDVFTG